MNNLRILSLFSGIGAFEKALSNIRVSYDLEGFSEIDKFAIKSYCAVHNESADKNLGDITKIDLDKLPKNVDILTHGSPCVSFSLAGKQLGGDEGSGTPSSLLWYSVDIIKRVQPKIVIWENVANVLSVAHKHNFEKYLSVLDEQGYNNFYAVLNGKDFGVAQKRKRLICVSIKKDCKEIQGYKINGNIDFTSLKTRKNVILRDILEKEYSANMIVHREVQLSQPKRKSDCICVGQSSNEGSQGGKVYSVDGIFPTICAGTHGYALGYILDNDVVRKLTPLEVLRLMGFSDIDYKKMVEIGLSDTQIYKQAGNSIVVPMLEEVFKLILGLDEYHQKRIIASAIKFYILGSEFPIIMTGYRHPDVFKQMQQMGIKYDRQNYVSGFLTDDNMFLDRYAAKEFAIKNGQISDSPHKELFSEDLW